MVSITPTSTPEQRRASRAKYAAYWELRDAMVALWDATTTKKAPFYLYACNLARIAGFKELFRGFDRPVFGSTDVTGPPPHNWRVEWESEGGVVSEAEAVHAEAEVFDRPGAMRLELYGASGMSARHTAKGFARHVARQNATAVEAQRRWAFANTLEALGFPRDFDLGQLNVNPNLTFSNIEEEVSQLMRG